MANYEFGAITKALHSADSLGDSDIPKFFSNDVRDKFTRDSRPQQTFSAKKLPTVDDDDAPKKEKKSRKRSRENNEKDIGISPENNVDNILTTDPESVPLTTSTISKDNRTIFVGNVPLSSTVASLTRFFKDFGDIESVRMRSVPIAGTAVDKAGDQNLVKKVCANTKLFGDQKGSYNAYVVFKEKDHAEAALQTNNQIIDNRHLRVDRSSPTLFDQKRTVFIGSLSHYTDEEELRSHFANVLPGGQDDIESIRLIRDPESLLCKGVGYLLLRSRDAVLKALSLHMIPFKKRELRVTTCGKRTKRTEQRKSGADVNNPAAAGSAKKPRREGDSGGGGSGAARRVLNKAKKMKPSDFIGKKPGSKDKTMPPKKRKQLGGAVKKAFKAVKNIKK